MAAQLVKSVARRADSRARRRIDRAGANRSQARDAWPAKPQYRIRTHSRISDAHKHRSQERQPSSRACANRQTLIFTELASRKLDCTQCLFYFSATHRHGGQRGFYLDVLDCGVFAASQNVPGAPARARQCRPTGRRAQGIFGAEWPSTRPNAVVVRAAGKTCCLK
ncbi:hypothetical protein Turpa_3344 [Turneriella parva DSM 21527]|uniref:Uncharacterized protein n=1 Tax=Turneriella parva (strain ATCC BAA-1111 / DSM 21527 / NCTC 11395 / H) TaxID=869212 RepID=I4B9M5_TURPD|nr:hypothetical protein Turpa_3344 [Turneriella parva DSM 21527]